MDSANLISREENDQQTLDYIQSMLAGVQIPEQGFDFLVYRNEDGTIHHIELMPIRELQ